jgi:hypothetical protein
MTELAKTTNRDQILAELDLVLASRYFAKKKKLPEILRVIVEKALAGKEITEISIADNAYPNEKETFRSFENSKVRVAIGEIRTYLAQYNEYEGKTDPIRIHLPLGSYTPTFEEQPQLPPKPGPSIPTPSNPPSTGQTRSVFGHRLLLAGGGLAACALLAGILWLVYDRPCAGSISITDPETRHPVQHRYVVQAVRASEQRFCNCKDDVIVEPTEQGVWWVQGRLPNGPRPSLVARFGEADTPSGTRFSVFILTLKADLPPGPVDRSSPSIENALQSPPVEVTLK